MPKTSRIGVSSRSSIGGRGRNDAPADPAARAAMFAGFAERYPHIVEMAVAASHDEASTVGGGCDDQFEFEFTLDLMLDGFETLNRHGWTSAVRT